MAHFPCNMRPKVAAAYIGLSASLLAKMRVYGGGPVYSKAGPRVVIYNVEDLDAWLAARRRRSTSDSGEAV